MSQDIVAAPEGAKLPRAPVRLDHKLTSVKNYVALGFATLILLIGGMGGWAATTDLAGAVLAPGTVVVASNVKKVQHPTGGVVGQIFVKNGDHVKAGDVLVRLDETMTRASLQVITRQMDELMGRIARLRAERDDATSVTFPEDLLKRASDPAITQILNGEKTHFETRVSTRASQKGQLGERISGLEEEISGLVSQAAAKTREIDLIAKELTGLETLEAKQLVPTTKINALRREGARLDGEKANLQAAAGTSRGKIAEIEMQKIGIDHEARSEVVKELREAEGKFSELGERRIAADDQLRRIDLKSPVDGVVHQMAVATIGGVINPADPLMLIVPEGDRLLIEARIAPQDIEQARSHDEATIRLTAFNQRTTPTVQGRVLTISADATFDQQNNISYFVARIEILDSEMKKIEGLKLVPGMPADVQIVTTARTALSYLTKPIEDQFAKAFKER